VLDGIDKVDTFIDNMTEKQEVVFEDKKEKQRFVEKYNLRNVKKN
jgi:hypothetical protein